MRFQRLRTKLVPILGTLFFLAAAPRVEAYCHTVKTDPETTAWITRIGDTQDLKLKHVQPPECPGSYRLEVLPGTGNPFITLEEFPNSQPQVADLRLRVLAGAWQQSTVHLSWRLYWTWNIGGEQQVNSGTASIAVHVSDGHVPPQVDVETSSLEVSTPTDSWQNFSLRASGRNIGGALLTRSEELRLWIDGKRAVGGQAIYDEECHQDYWNYSTCDMEREYHVEPGTRTVKVCADWDHRTSDQNHANNCLEQTIVVPPLQADLEVFFGGTSAGLRYGEPWSFTIDVYNVGNGNSPPFEVRLETPDGVETFSQPALGWGFSTSIQASWTPTVGGNVTLRAIADPGGLVPDHDRSNNERSWTVTVQGSPPVEVPNLLFEQGAWSVSPVPPRSGAPVTFTARLRNDGSVPTGQAPRFTIDAGGVISIACPSPLQAGGECLGSYTFTPNTAGEWTVEMVADPDDLIDEGDGEGDNFAVVSFLVEEAEAPDPAQLFFGPGDVAPSGAIPVAGGDLNVAITVRNAGGDIQGQAVELQILEDGQWVDLMTIPPPFLGGTGRTVFYLWNDITAGAHELRVIADPGNYIPELLEEDNIRSLFFQIDGAGPAITCQGVWDLQDVVTGETFSNLGSVTDDCQVNWGNNVPTATCWQTAGINGLTATWIPGTDGCPIEARVSNGIVYSVVVNPN